MSALRVLAFLASIGFSSSQTSDCSYLGVLKHLNLTSSDALEIIRPVKNWTTPTFVHVDMYLYGILNVDEKSQTVTSHIQVQMIWSNEILTWKSSDFCGINMLSVPISRLWIPDLTIQEDASDTGSIQRSQFASVFPSGWVLASIRQRLTSTCQLKLWLFPFDTQNCTITFVSMSLGGNTIKLGTLNNDTTLTEFSELLMVTQGEWELKKLDIIDYAITNNSKAKSKLIYRVTIVRKPMLYVINFIVPLFYLLVLDLASFFVSEARGEKLSFKVTILLSISVLLLILKDMLPSTEDKLPLIASYSVAIFALVGISVLETMLVSFLTDLDGYCDMKAQSSVNDQMEIQLEANYHKETAGAEEEGSVKQDKNFLSLGGPNGSDLLTLILEEVKAARQEAERQDKDKRKPRYYRRVAEVIDSVFFVLYFLTVVIFLVFMYKVWVIM